MPANHTSAANPATLVLPDVLTELDLLAPLPDPGLLLALPGDNLLGLGRADSSLLDFGSQVSSQIERGRRASTPLRLEEDIGLDLDLGTDVVTPSRGRDIEVGRDAPTALSMLEDRDETLKLYENDDLELDLGLDQTELPGRASSSVMPDFQLPPLDDDIQMGGMDDDAGLPIPQDEPEIRQRQSESPLSSVRSSVERDLERTMHPEQQQEEEVDETIQQAQRVKRRKVLQPDLAIELNSREIRMQQNDRSRILKPASFLPRDPVLLALMEMQRTGGFVSNILGDGRSRGWAPELRGILSLELIRQPPKRKRDEDVPAERTASPAINIPELNINPVDDAPIPVFDMGEDTVIEPLIHDPADPTLPPMGQEDDEPLPVPRFDSEEAVSLGPGMDIGLPSDADAFDDTTAPLLHPSQSGPVSLGTKHAVHRLREHFGPAAEHSAEERARTTVLFQDLLPERTTSRADATKMFFEILVLATKDAVKVEQSTDVLGADLRVRAKRGLWGQWAEMEAGGQIEGQDVVAEAVAAA